VQLLIREQVRVASFALAPSERQIKTLKDAGVRVVPSIGARRHAEKVAAWGVDAVIVQGGEGGGHTGAVATTLLLPQVVDAVDLPVIAAGGFFDGRGLAAADLRANGARQQSMPACKACGFQEKIARCECARAATADDCDRDMLCFGHSNFPTPAAGEQFGASLAAEA